MLDMKCDEEALHYLELIRKTFYRVFDKILRGDETALQRVDQATVKASELKAPRYSKRDARCLKRLVRVSRRDTVRTAFDGKFPYTEEAGDQYVVEVAESTIVDRSGRAVDRFDLGYRHLWLFAMRDYREMPPDAKKKSKDLLAKAGVQRTVCEPGGLS